MLPTFISSDMKEHGMAKGINAAEWFNRQSFHHFDSYGLGAAVAGFDAALAKIDAEIAAAEERDTIPAPPHPEVAAADDLAVLANYAAIRMTNAETIEDRALCMKPLQARTGRKVHLGHVNSSLAACGWWHRGHARFYQGAEVTCEKCLATPVYRAWVGRSRP